MPAESNGKRKSAITWWVSSHRRDYRVLATFFNFEISGLADRFLMEIAVFVKEKSRNGNVYVRDFLFRLKFNQLFARQDRAQG